MRDRGRHGGSVRTGAHVGAHSGAHVGAQNGAPTEGPPRAECALATQTPRITRAHPDQRLTTAHTGHVRRTGTKSGTNLDAVSFVGRPPSLPLFTAADESL